jgi:hypothetical protein
LSLDNENFCRTCKILSNFVETNVIIKPYLKDCLRNKIKEYNVEGGQADYQRLEALFF